MADPADTLREHLANVVALGRRTPSGLAAMHEVDDTDLIALVPAVQALLNAGHGLLALAAGEIARRDGGRKEPSLAQRHGHRTARALLADRAGISYGQASAHVAVGEFIRRSTDAAGQTTEPERPHVAEAVLAGELSIPLALLIDDTLEALRTAVSAVELDALEAVLVEQATSGEQSVKAFTVECKRLIAKTDPDGAKDRDEALRAKASIRHTTLPNGLLRVVADLDPERAAYYLAAIRAKTNPRRPDTGSGAEDPAQPDAASSSTAGPQPDPMVTRLDAFTSICQDSLKADDGVQAGVDTTVLVRIDLHDLQAGTGSAAIDGIDTPISAAAARRLAVNADIIPQVFGGTSQLLDQGQARRLFTKAQRYAIYAGYDACAFPGCDLPLAMTEIHHLGRWATRHQHGSGTDVGNGIPLCGFHNRLMEHGWDATLDPDGTPLVHPTGTPPPRPTPRTPPHRTTSRLNATSLREWHLHARTAHESLVLHLVPSLLDEGGAR